MNEDQELLDRFAGQALKGLCAHFTGPKQKGAETIAQAHARAAYEYADAMMKERGKRRVSDPPFSGTPPFPKLDMEET